jgi:DNA-binding beta-propeller fold protein YncE
LGYDTAVGATMRLGRAAEPGGRMGRLCARLIVAAALAAAPRSAVAQDGRIYVLDQEARSVTLLDLPGAQVVKTVAVEGSPSRLLRTADGARLIVLDQGEGRDAGDAGFQAKSRAAATIFDGRTLAVRGRVDLGWGLGATPMLSANGDRLSVVGLGYQGRTAAESLPREVITVDLAAGKVLSRIELPRKATAAIATPDGRTAVVLSAHETPRKAPALPAELRFLDLTAGTVAATVPLDGDPGAPVLAPDGQFVYLLDRGKPDNNPDKNVNGRLHAVSMTTRTVAAVTEVGSKPRGLVLDERGRQLLIVSDGPPFKGPGNRDRQGELRVVRGAAPAAPIPVGTGPERLETSPDGRTLWVLGTYSAAKLALPGLEPSPPVTFKTWGEELTVSPDGGRLYMLNGEYLYTYDVATGQKIKDVRTGRMGMKTLLALEAGLKTETSRLEARNEARRQGRSYYAYTEYTLTEPRGTLAIPPDGRAIFALNSQTSDVTIVDGATGEIIRKVPAGGFAVHFMPAAGVALVPSASEVHAVSLATHQKLADVVTLSTASFAESALSPDARSAVVHGTGGIAIVDTLGGKPVGVTRTFQRVAAVAIDWGIKR